MHDARRFESHRRQRDCEDKDTGQIDDGHRLEEPRDAAGGDVRRMRGEAKREEDGAHEKSDQRKREEENGRMHTPSFTRAGSEEERGRHDNADDDPME